MERVRDRAKETEAKRDGEREQKRQRQRELGSDFSSTMFYVCVREVEVERG